MLIARIDESVAPTRTDMPVRVGNRTGWRGQGIGYNFVAVPFEDMPSPTALVLAGTVPAGTLLHLASLAIAEPPL